MSSFLCEGPFGVELYLGNDGRHAHPMVLKISDDQRKREDVVSADTLPASHLWRCWLGAGEEGEYITPDILFLVLSCLSLFQSVGCITMAFV